MTKYRDILNKERKKYLKKWSNDSKFFYDNKYYDWMNSHIKDYKVVLEIGCGNGLSTLSLIENGHHVIVIDENIECLKETRKTLETKKIKSKIIQREGLFREYKDSYEYNYKKINHSFEENQILLIEGDVLNDNHLESWLLSIDIDCVVCWLMGSHGARRYNKIIAEKKIITPQNYRFVIQNSIYEMADRILKDNGILQIVDRGRKPSNEEEKSFLESHQDQASVTALIVEEIKFLEYKHDIKDGVAMSVEEDQIVTKHKDLKQFETVFVSAISRKSQKTIN